MRIGTINGEERKRPGPFDEARQESSQSANLRSERYPAKTTWGQVSTAEQGSTPDHRKCPIQNGQHGAGQLGIVPVGLQASLGQLVGFSVFN